MTKFLSITLCLSVMQGSVSGQALPPIQLDRPDQTECPFITPSKYIQVENGLTIEKNALKQRSYSHPSSLWKYGLNEKLEFRLITELVTVEGFEKSQTGLAPVTIGFKTALFEEKGLIPKTSFIGHLTPAHVGSKAFQTNRLAPAFRFTMQHTLTEKMSLAYNVGAEWDGESAEHTTIYTMVTGFSLTEKLGCYAEIYGFIPVHGTADHRLDGGFTYLISNDFILDLSGGVGITKSLPSNYVSFGFSYRLQVRK
jgi:Putative MetA-pathway of phenol degradation